MQKVLSSRFQVSGKIRGFTLIELLVVIAIIGILAAIILASLSSAKQKGNDAKRVSDLKQIQLALELYNDQNNGYPASSGLQAVSTALASSIVPGDISQMPADPQNTGSCGTAGDEQYCYESTNGSGTACSSGPCAGYVIQADLQTSAATGVTGSSIPSGVTCTTSGSNYYYCQTN